MRNRIKTETESVGRRFLMLALAMVIVVTSLHAQSLSTTSSAASTMPTADSGLTFEQLYELAARDNLQINAVRRRRAVAEAGVQIAGQRPNPDFIAGYTRSEPRLNLSISQPIELGGNRVWVARP